MSLHRQAPDLSVLLHSWGESTVDPELHAVLEQRAEELRSAFERALSAWVAAQPEGSDELAPRTAQLWSSCARGSWPTAPSSAR